MLQRYKLFDKNVELKTVKRRMDNLRSSYRREHKKALLDKHHFPQLWYYRNLKFLNEAMTFHTSPRRINNDEYDSGACGSSDSRMSKKRTYNIAIKNETRDEGSGPEENYITEYLENETEDDTTPEESYQIVARDEPYVIKPREPDYTEANAFGRALGLQLDELTPMQKTIAEKLISDVIYNARLDRLTTQTSLVNLNEDCF